MSVQGLNTRRKRARGAAKNGTLRGLRQFKLMPFLFTLLAVLGTVHALSMLGVETYRSLSSTAEIARLSADVGALQAEINELSAIAQHADDEVYLTHLARCYGFAYPNEVRFVTLVDVKDQPATGTVLCR